MGKRSCRISYLIELKQIICCIEFRITLVKVYWTPIWPYVHVSHTGSMNTGHRMKIIVFATDVVACVAQRRWE